MNRSRRLSGARRAGFTIIELAISVTILGLFAGMLVHSLRSMQGLSNSSSTISQLQDMSERAIKAINLDLKRSGFVAPGGGPAYPQFFLDGAAAPPHQHPPPVKQAQPGDPDFGPNREIVFLQPQDANGDDIPDSDGQGRRVWGVRAVS